MANELEKAAGNMPAVARTMSPAEMFASLVDLAKDPQVDPAKMTSLVDLQMKMMDYAKQEEFNKAKLAAIMDMPVIGKRGEIKNKNGGVQSRYSRFEDIHRTVMPILKRNSLVISFNVDHSGQMVTVQPILSHANGYVEKGGAMALPIDTTGSKNGTQGAGSAASYGKRHTMKAMLNIVEGGEDDDGHSAGSGDPLYEEAQAAASCGIAAYERWFRTEIDVQKRAKIVANDWHEAFKEAAARADKQQEKDDDFPADRS